jgi:tetratricopeptide (TPR) repeat protein
MESGFGTAFGPLRRLLTCGLLATVLGVAGCSQSLRLPPAPPSSEIPDLQERTSGAPDDVRASVRLGAAYWAAGRLTEAEAELLRAWRLAPHHPAPAFYLGTTYEDQERFTEARDMFEAYLERGASPRLQAAVRDRLKLLARKELEASVRAALAGETALASTPPRANTVGLFPFLYSGADPALQPLGRAVAELLATDLALTDRLTVVERLRVQLLLDEIALGEAGATDSTAAARAGRMLGAGRIVQGRLDGEEESLLMEALVVPVGQEAAAIASLSDRDALQRLFDLQKRLVMELYASLGIQLTPAERELINQRPTEHVQALLAFGEGLEAGDGGRFSAAAAHFAAAAALDPGFTEATLMAEEARAMDAASRTSTRGLALLDDGDLLTELGPEDWDRLQASLRDMWFYLPGPTGRDPVSESSGTEGFGLNNRAGIEFIFRRP